jgi:hypothetical protein
VCNCGCCRVVLDFSGAEEVNAASLLIRRMCNCEDFGLAPSQSVAPSGCVEYVNLIVGNTACSRSDRNRFGCPIDRYGSSS